MVIQRRSVSLATYWGAGTDDSDMKHKLSLLGLKWCSFKVDASHSLKLRFGAEYSSRLYECMICLVVMQRRRVGSL